jgi:hypothetical protein
MAIANLANIPSDPLGLLRWSFAHMDHHRLINVAIQQRTGTSLPLYPIDPINPQDMGTFLYQHSQMHGNQNAILGISNFNLLDADFTDENQRATWVFQNFTEHLAASNILGVG